MNCYLIFPSEVLALLMATLSAQKRPGEQQTPTPDCGAQVVDNEQACRVVSTTVSMQQACEHNGTRDQQRFGSLEMCATMAHTLC